jgi:hypothetical protein
MISEHPADIVLLDYVEGVLDGDESLSVRRHIASCRACRRTLSEISTAVDELERLPTAEMEHDAFSRRHSRHRLRIAARFAPLVIAAAALVVALLLARPGSAPTTSNRVKPSLVVQQARLKLTLAKTSRLRELQGVLDNVQGKVIPNPAGPGFIAVVPSRLYLQTYRFLQRWKHDDGVPVVLAGIRDEYMPDAANVDLQEVAEPAAQH